MLCGGAMGQQAQQDQNSMAAQSKHNKQEYADLHGYDLIDASNMIDESRPPAWSKLPALKKQLDEYDYVMWIDTDTIIMNMDVKLEWLVHNNARPNNKRVAESKGTTPTSTSGEEDWDVLLTTDLHGVNTGIMLLRSSGFSKWLLDEWWGQDHLMQSGLLFEYEQRGLHFLLNTPQWRNQWFFSSPPLYKGNSQQITSHVKILPQCAMNSYIISPWTKNFFLYSKAGRLTDASYAPGDFVLHFAGFKGKRKQELFGLFYRAWFENYAHNYSSKV
jgi:hypothetical protein